MSSNNAVVFVKPPVEYPVFGEHIRLEQQHAIADARGPCPAYWRARRDDEHATRRQPMLDALAFAQERFSRTGMGRPGRGPDG